VCVCVLCVIKGERGRGRKGESEKGRKGERDKRCVNVNSSKVYFYFIASLELEKIASIISKCKHWHIIIVDVVKIGCSIFKQYLNFTWNEN